MQFMREQVLPQMPKVEAKDYGVLTGLLRSAGELGLLMIDVPEAGGGLGLDKTTSMLVGEATGWLGSYTVTQMAHTGIGTLPIVWFGNAEQKARLLPALATGEKIAAYALTEPGSGSDALGAKTKAVLSEDGESWILNGSKLYITNAAFADVFTVFAKVDGEKFTAFLVEKGTPGLTVGPEEHKMGIRGSSTCPLYFEDARIPKANVLGEIGRGHKIAFNILNYGRLKLAAMGVGAMKEQLQNATRFAQERKQFATPVIQFGLTREKLAHMAAITYAVESMAYRTSGLVDAVVEDEDKTSEAYSAKVIAAIEEYAIEASIMKVFGSEALSQLLDDALQIHGGSGFIEEYPVEAAYRDSRVNRIFEGTNEINRILIANMLLKRAAKGGLGLMAGADSLAPAAAREGGDGLAAEADTAEALKRLVRYALKVATEAHGDQLEARQEILASVADVVMDAFALDSCITRTRQGAALDPARVAMVKLYAQEAHARGLERIRKVLCACTQGAALATHLARVEAAAPFVPYDPLAVREAIMKGVEAAGGYPQL